MPFELETPVAKQKLSFVVKSYFVNRATFSLNANIEWTYSDGTTGIESFSIADEDESTAFSDFYSNFTSDQSLYDLIADHYNLTGTSDLAGEPQ